MISRMYGTTGKWTDKVYFLKKLNRSDWGGFCFVNFFVLKLRQGHGYLLRRQG